jgi:hypothetical protein
VINIDFTINNAIYHQLPYVSQYAFIKKDEEAFGSTVQKTCGREVLRKKKVLNYYVVIIFMFHRKIKNRISVVEKVIYRSLTGQMLGLTFHNHSKWRIHLCWSNETGTPTYKDALERSFFREKDRLRFCEALK